MAQAYERKQSFIVALDNDRAGLQGWRKARDASADWAGFQISSHFPERKDWNDDLAWRALRSLNQASCFSQAMSDPHEAILEVYFFAFVDRGSLAEDTPLFTGVHDGESLSSIIALQFRLSPQEAEAAVESARREVAL
jgi:hypothetical protein